MADTARMSAALYFITRLPDGNTVKFHGDTAREALLGWCRETFAHEGKYAVVDSTTGRSRVYQVTTSVLYKLTPVNMTNADEAEVVETMAGVDATLPGQLEVV
jgi:hypothetical protein